MGSEAPGQLDFGVLRALEVRRDAQPVRRSLLGHSFGGLIAAAYTA